MRRLEARPKTTSSRRASEQHMKDKHRSKQDKQTPGITGQTNTETRCKVTTQTPSNTQQDKHRGKQGKHTNIKQTNRNRQENKG